MNKKFEWRTLDGIYKKTKFDLLERLETFSLIEERVGFVIHISHGETTLLDFTSAKAFYHASVETIKSLIIKKDEKN